MPSPRATRATRIMKNITRRHKPVLWSLLFFGGGRGSGGSGGGGGGGGLLGPGLLGTEAGQGSTDPGGAQGELALLSTQ